MPKPEATPAPEGAADTRGFRLQPEDPPTDFAPLVDTAAPRRTVGDVLVGIPTGGMTAKSGRTSDQLVGTLVHRLIQRVGFTEAAPTAELVAQLLRPDERMDGGEGVVPAAIEAYQALSRHTAVRDLYADGEVLHEVPFTMRHEGGWMRGTIDCVIRRGAVVTVLEFKTGRPRPEHAVQVELYQRAAARLFPGCDVHARLVYSNEVAAT